MAMNRLPLDAPGAESEFARVEVRRSTRRRKTILAEIVGDALIVSIPERLSRAEEQEWVSRMAARMSERRRRDRLNADGDLARRAAQLADEYLDGVRATDIAWVTNQRSRWGSCSPDDGSIRLSLALADYPRWVCDYVIVHELAHLKVADHSERFWKLVNRYPLTERARGFLRTLRRIVVPLLTPTLITVMVLALLLGQLGELLQLPQWLMDLSPYSHVPSFPTQDVSWPPLIALTLVAGTIQPATRGGIPVAVCGEMAGDLMLTRLLLGLGLRNFSMLPSQLLPTKERILRTNLAEVQTLAQRVLRATDPAKTRDLLSKLNA